MLNSSSKGKRQVDDFNTVAEAAEVAMETERPSSSARSDPGVGGTGGVGQSGRLEPQPQPEPQQSVPDVAPTPTPAPSDDDHDEEAAEPGAIAEIAIKSSPPREPTPQTSLPTTPAPMAEPAAGMQPPAELELLARSQPANTPTTPCTDFSKRRGASRPSQQTATTALRRQCYDEAVSLVAARCVTNPLSSSDWRRPGRWEGEAAPDPPPGFGGPRVFYVRQQRPRPMTPLKAWAGYHGNVYFTPLRIRRSEFAHPDSLLSLPSLPACSGPLQRVLEPTRLNAEHLLLMRAKSEAAAQKRRAPPRRATVVGGQPQQQQPLVQLDRAYLTSRAASRQQDDGAGGSMTNSRDVHLYRSAHATGTLQFQHQELQRLTPDPEQAEPQPASGRVYRGSVSRKLRDLRLAMSTESALQPAAAARSPALQQHQQRLAAGAAAGGGAGAHNNSVASLDREIDRLYDRMPSLMAKVPLSQALKQQQQQQQLKFRTQFGAGAQAQR